MEFLAKFFALIVLPWVLAAQDRPQFVWQGDVDGTDILYIHGRKLNVKIQEGAPVAREKFQLYDALPETSQDARVEVREGRGYVHIVDQPRIDNGFTLAVSIEDRQPGSSFYSIALYWDATNNSFESNARRDQVTWSGRVTHDEVISCQAKHCEANAPIAQEKFKFSRPLPNRDIDLKLDQALGRGEIKLVEQPREKNHYTARVAIHDAQAGGSEYSFVLSWGRGGGKTVIDAPVAGPGLHWNGTVDGRIRVAIQGGSAFTSVLDGQPVVGGRSEFLRPLPARSDLQPAIKKLRGRGEVRIVETPSAANHFHLVFEINDAEPGADEYEIEVDW